MKLTNKDKQTLADMYFTYLSMGEGFASDDDCRKLIERLGVVITIQDIIGENKIDNIRHDIESGVEKGTKKTALFKAVIEEYELHSYPKEVKVHLDAVYKEEVKEHKLNQANV